jgi:hypothetical protein
MKKKKRDVLRCAGPAEKPLAVPSRKQSKKPIKSPSEDEGLDARKLKAAQRKFEGTTPPGRDIIRKIIMTARRKLFESPPASRGAQRAATPQPPQSGPASSAQAAAVKVAAAPPPAPAASLPPSAAKVTQPSPPVGPAMVSLLPAPTAATPPAPVPPSAAPAECHDMATLSPGLPQPRHPVGGCSMEEALRLGLVGRRNK